ncbi:hypothetical protein HOE425_320097 [Hoeflea sp. EC-HK425]|nr:hypothetical protein HOE425_320097 [Hoeflea sp. EC-HK425]
MSHARPKREFGEKARFSLRWQRLNMAARAGSADIPVTGPKLVANVLTSVNAEILSVLLI